jgi:hypothetical protein
MFIYLFLVLGESKSFAANAILHRAYNNKMYLILKKKKKKCSVLFSVKSWKSVIITWKRRMGGGSRMAD